MGRGTPQAEFNGGGTPALTRSAQKQIVLKSTSVARYFLIDDGKLATVVVAFALIAVGGGSTRANAGPASAEQSMGWSPMKCVEAWNGYSGARARRDAGRLARADRKLGSVTQAGVLWDRLIDANSGLCFVTVFARIANGTLFTYKASVYGGTAKPYEPTGTPTADAASRLPRIRGYVQGDGRLTGG
jgi:hypothetical protein